MQSKNSHQGDEPPECSTGKINPVIVQPFPAADVDRLCAAGVKRMFFCLFLISGAVVHRLYRRAEEGVEQRACKSGTRNEQKGRGAEFAGG